MLPVGIPDPKRQYNYYCKLIMAKLKDWIRKLLSCGKLHLVKRKFETQTVWKCGIKTKNIVPCHY